MDRSQSWGPGFWGYGYGGPEYGYGGPGFGPGPYGYGDLEDGPYGTEGEDDQHPNIHETKEELEALKAAYRDGKQKFRQQKEGRRKARQELAERRAEGREQLRNE